MQFPCSRLPLLLFKGFLKKADDRKAGLAVPLTLPGAGKAGTVSPAAFPFYPGYVLQRYSSLSKGYTEVEKLPKSCQSTMSLALQCCLEGCRVRLVLWGGCCLLPASTPALHCSMLREAGSQRWPSSPMGTVHFLQGDVGAALSRSRFNPFPPFLPLGSEFPGGWTLTWLEVGGVSGCLELLLSQHLTAAGAGEEATELCG